MWRAAGLLRTRALLLLLVLPGMLALSGCEEDLVIKPDFSVNVFQPGPKWPNVKKLTLAQKEIYEKYGKPDFFHVWWTPDGELRARTDAEKEMKAKKAVPMYSWVYLGLGKDIVFRGKSYQELALTDEIRVITKYGDPEDVQKLASGLKQWMFYGAGKLFKFANGRLVEEKEFPAMGSFHKM